MDKSQGSKNADSPLILIFSPRERIRSILLAGLLQCNYRVMEADTPHLAAIKAGQFLPDLVIADITAQTSKDFFLVTRLRKSLRTKRISVLVAVPLSMGRLVDRIQAAMKEEKTNAGQGTIHLIEFPFNFADLLKKIESVIGIEGAKGRQREGAASNEAIARELCDLQVPVQKKLREIEGVLRKQWAFPFTVIKAMDILDSDSSCGDQLAQCIETDQGATAAVLRVANTVYYARREQKISNVRDAVVRLGFRETRNLLACLALIDLSPELHKSYGFSRHEFWMHSLSTGLIAEKLCADCGFRRPELAFVAGLVHDLGKVPIDNNFLSVFSHLLEETATAMGPFYETEERLLGFHHASLGHYLLTMWNFPSSIPLAVLNHHDAVQIIETKTPAERILQGAVFAANILAKALGLGHSCDEILEGIPYEILDELHISNGPSDTFFRAIFRRLHQLCKYLAISTKELVYARERTELSDFDIAVVYGAKIGFHPLVPALRNNGFHAETVSAFLPEVSKKVKIWIFIPDQGSALDLTLEEEEKDSPSILKLFLLDCLPKTDGPDLSRGNIVLMSRRNLDLRLVLHAFDRFLERVVTPVGQSLESLEEEKPASA